MKLIDEELLREFRALPSCEVCCKAKAVEVHHILCRGMGGGGRIDHRFNLLAVCRDCHTKIHAANLTIRGRRLTREDLFEIVSRREGVSVDEIERTLYAIRRMKKEARGSTRF